MFAEDVAFIVESLNLDSLVFLGVSMGCWEGLPACSFSSTALRQVQRLHLDGPFSPANLKAFPKEIWDSVLLGLITDRVSFTR